MIVDYHVHAMGHRDYEHSKEDVARFLESAVEKGLSEIGFADHDKYIDSFHLDIIREAAEDFPSLNVRLGIEVDYFSGREEEIQKIISRYEFDYVIGSIHHIQGWNFDNPRYRDGFEKWDIDDLYEAYFEEVYQLAKSGLFDIVGHLDLIKIYGHRPSNDVLQVAEKALLAIRDTGLVVELNANGLNKPVGEMYPEMRLLIECHRLGIPLITSSDAHHPEEVAQYFDRSIKALKDIGVRETPTFERRKLTMKPLG